MKKSVKLIKSMVEGILSFGPSGPEYVDPPDTWRHHPGHKRHRDFGASTKPGDEITIVPTGIGLEKIGQALTKIRVEKMLGMTDGGYMVRGTVMDGEHVGMTIQGYAMGTSAYMTHDT